ncbi:PepSY domain-containing protein [Nodosilinea nodulosa]|uniref:PepSY domain-containing protein n=1 Tax=Nodosilinea nodulosa TaxID=416001 RepID=UPI0002F5C888|nr:PepSY domain-containing protein [Nodosilinea nodulosa]
MKKSLAFLPLAIAGTLAAGGAVRGVYAKQSPPPAAIAQSAPAVDSAAGRQADGELPDHQEQGEQPDAPEEQQEDAQLQALAKITAQQAETAARSVASGHVSRISLDNEDGSVVYKVVVGQQEVLVDAGSGQVLETEVANRESTPDAAPQGTVQVPDSEGNQELEGQ